MIGINSPTKAFAALLLLFYTLSTPVFSEEIPDGELLRSEFLGLQITIPDGWYNATQPGEDDRLILASRDNDKAYLLISRMPGQKRTLESFDRTTRHFIFTEMKGFLDEEKHTTVVDRPAYLWVYQGESRVNDNGWRKFYRIVAEKDSDFVVFHGVMESKDFVRYRGTLEKMINSVSWINTELIGE